MTTTRTRPLTVLALAAALGSAGCYGYQPAPPTAGPEGTVLRAELTEAGTSAIAGLVGPSAIRVEGALRATDDSTITLAVSELERRGLDPERWNGERVRLPRSGIALLSVRSFSATRTASAVAIAVIGALVARSAVGGGGNGATSVITPPPPGK